VQALERHRLPGTGQLFRKALPPDVVLVAAGGVWTRSDAEAVLDMGASAVAIGRAAITNPEWATKAVEPRWQPRRPPVSPAQLRACGLNDRFAAYMRSWQGFVAD
jgi:2,4-dienoyl-CoA reductase-like NADH-dependent reductase (Old Yellow Enzyme family)